MRLLWQVVVPPTVLVVALLLLAGVVDGSATDPGTLAARAAGGAAVSALVVLVLRRVGERAVSPARDGSLTKGARAAVTEAAAGFLAWTVPAVLALVVLGLVLDTAPTLEGVDPLRVGVLLALAVLLSEAVPEELVFRGHLLGLLLPRTSAWRAVAVQTVAFAGTALVLRGWTGVLDLSLFVAMGAVLGYLRLRTGSVWVAVGFHTAFQTGSQLVLTHELLGADVPDTVLLALGAVPFTCAVLLADAYASRRGPVPGPDVEDRTGVA